ncbi:MAG: sulfite exporter TauE/SafE family protein [Victivallaceae bacterium]|nr:sulfite exporter TauE/SafE family protein [Victivallaceae bacterium]
MMNYVYYLAPLVGFVAMLAGGFWGLGGGWFAVPVLLTLGISNPVAAGASLLQMIPSTFLTVVRQFRSIGWGKNSWGLTVALPLCGMAFLGGFFGRPAGALIQEMFHSRKPHQCLYLILLGFILYKTLRHKSPAPADPVAPRTVSVTSTAVTGVTGFLVGVLSSLLGIGGGTITRPVMLSYLQVPEVFTGKIARLAVFITAVSGTASYLLQIQSFKPGDPGTDSLLLGLLMAAGGFIGFPVGAWLHGKVIMSGHAEKAARSFSYVVVLVLASLFCKIIDWIVTSQVIILICGLFLLTFLPAFTVRSCKHPDSRP